MHRTIIIAILAAAAGASLASAQTPATAPEPSKECVPSLGPYMNLSVDGFDQDMSGGWREIAHKKGCEKAAADLIAFYRKERIAAWDAQLEWHEAQMRASAGETARAIELFRKNVAYETALHEDAMQFYGEATVAFLEHDRVALQAARARLAALPPPTDFALSLTAFKKRHPDQPPPVWPVNLETVDGLIRCFDKPYAEAYGTTACRATGAR